MMLVCERWTLTHSSGAVVPVPLAEALGLVLTSAASDAVVVLVAVAVPVWDGEVEAVRLSPLLTLADGEDSLDGSLAAVEWPAAGLADFVGEGDGDGDGDGDVEGDDDGEGVGVPVAGRAWHTVSVLLAVATGAACALSSGPRLRRLPLSKVTAATLTCAKRIWDRPSLLLVSVTVCSLLIRTRYGPRMGTCTHFR